MDCTNIYIPKYSESFKMIESPHFDLLRVWRIEDMKVNKNADDIPHGI